jgi:glucan biosynthesis protein C
MSSRYHYLDAARGILMILGIVYHTARVYGDGTWVIADPATSPALAHLALLLTRFRMPAFFLMSGFFAAQTLGRHGPASFLRKRLPRVLIPFVVTLFTLNVAQLYALNVYHGGQPAGPAYLVSAAMWGDFTSDRWISHLWFLLSLAYYFTAVALGAVLLDGGRRGAARVAQLSRATRLVDRPVLCLLLCPLANVAILALFWTVPVLYAIRPIVSMEDILLYVPYFTAGLLAFVNRGFYESITRFHWEAVVLTAGVLLAALSGGVTGPTLAARAGGAYLGFLGTWTAVYWVLVGFRAIFDRPSPVSYTLADSAYSIYLFHHLGVILLAWAFIPVDLGVFVKFALVIGLTLAITLSLHLFVIRRVPWLTVLFNGKWPAAAPTARSRGAI